MSVDVSLSEQPGRRVYPHGRPRPLFLVLLGPGQVGSALLDQLSVSLPVLEHRSGLDIRVAGVADSRFMRRFDAERDTAPSLAAWRLGAEIADPDALLAHGLARDGELLVVDCTASDEVADHYADWLEQGIHVVTANKHAGSGCMARYRRILEAASAGGACFRCEATVGAGLPVIQTLQELQESGDELISVQGCLSGTLSWLCNEYDGRMPFSSLLLKARELGYTEPDPRDDLSGMDVARKLLILAREAGMALSMDELVVENLIPASLTEVAPDAFLRYCSVMDDSMAERLADASAAGGRLAYVGRLERGGPATVGLEVLPASHPCAQLRGSDNLVQLHTRHYQDTPLVVRGPGAGPTVTAAGVLRDVISVARQHRVRA